MALPHGSRIGPYEVVALIGKGGMGEVYSAHDGRLGRHVAIKILSQEFTSDPARVQRFEREARALAAINHPHIATIHGVEEVRGVTALVMELVDGETLSEQIARGPIPIGTALALAGQIADALDAAHEKGIVHRDLKPSNIKVTPARAIKVLDFGLAKGGESGRRGPDDASGVSDASRLTAIATMDETLPGVLLGTAAYMSPEQARGHAVDKRTDIWAFGCVLFEMLTGRSTFGRSTTTDTIAAVLEHDPDWTALPGNTPPGVVRILRKCLEKEQRRRLRDLGDWDLGIEPAAAVPSPRGQLQIPQWIPWAALVACVGAGGLFLANRTAPSPAAPAPLTRFDIPAGVSLSESGQFSISPDGRHLVFAGIGDDRMIRLWIRSFDAPEVRPLIGTEAEVAQVIPPMFWSPDSQFIAFYADGKIMKVSRVGGTVPEMVCQVPSTAVGGSWNTRGDILAGNADGGLTRCSAAGGPSSTITAANETEPGRVDHLLPSFLPDGRHFIYFQAWRGNPSRSGIYLGDLDLPPDKQPQERLLATGFGGVFVGGDGNAGHVLFVRDATLMAVPFDGRLTGEPQALANGLGAFRDTAFFSASPTTVVYRGVASDTQLTWIDRKTKVRARVGDPGPFTRLALSPDGTRAIVVRENRLNRYDQDLWTHDLVRNTETPFTSDVLSESAPAWSPDGAEVWYSGETGGGNVHRKPSNGTGAASVVLSAKNPPRVNPATTSLSLSAWASGQLLVFTATSSTGTRQDIWMLPPGPDAKPIPLIDRGADQTDGQLSRDGRWLAYVSNESGGNEVFVASVSAGSSGLPVLGSSVVVSSGGGQKPRWRGDSRELLYQTITGAIMAVPITGDSVGAPIELMRLPGILPDWGVAPDGQRLLVAIPTQPVAATQFSVVLNWRTLLR